MILGIGIGYIIVSAASLVAGWLFLPQPRFITWIAEKLGIKDRA